MSSWPHRCRRQGARVTIVGRTASVHRLAEAVGGVGAELVDLDDRLRGADVPVSATGATGSAGHPRTPAGAGRGAQPVRVRPRPAADTDPDIADPGVDRLDLAGIAGLPEAHVATTWSPRLRTWCCGQPRLRPTPDQRKGSARGRRLALTRRRGRRAELSRLRLRNPERRRSSTKSPGPCAGGGHLAAYAHRADEGVRGRSRWRPLARLPCTHWSIWIRLPSPR